MFSFKPKVKKKDRGLHSEKIETWFKSSFNVMTKSSLTKHAYQFDFEDVVVSIAQIKCVEPGCPPLETVIAVLDAEKPLRLSIRKCLKDVCEADVTQSIQDWIEDKVQPCNCGDVILQAYRLKIDKKVDTSEILVDHKDALSKDEQEAKSTSTFEDIDRMVGFAMNKDW